MIFLTTYIHQFYCASDGSIILLGCVAHLYVVVGGLRMQTEAQVGLSIHLAFFFEKPLLIFELTTYKLAS